MNKLFNGFEVLLTMVRMGIMILAPIGIIFSIVIFLIYTFIQRRYERFTELADSKHKTLSQLAAIS